MSFDLSYSSTYSPFIHKQVVCLFLFAFRQKPSHPQPKTVHHLSLLFEGDISFSSLPQHLICIFLYLLYEAVEFFCIRDPYFSSYHSISLLICKESTAIKNAQNKF